MMKKYNDYENIMYGYLKNYNQFQAKLKDIDIEISTVTEQINSLTDVKIAKYDNQPTGGFNELSSVELNVERKQKLAHKIQSLQTDKLEISGLLRRIDNALEALPYIDRTIIQKKFIYGYPWFRIAAETKYSERSCQRMMIGAIQRLTRTLFGNTIYEQGRLFIFVDNQYKICG